jgi:hypothetical protein
MTAFEKEWDKPIALSFPDTGVELKEWSRHFWQAAEKATALRCRELCKIPKYASLAATYITAEYKLGEENGDD